MCQILELKLHLCVCVFVFVPAMPSMFSLELHNFGVHPFTLQGQSAAACKQSEPAALHRQSAETLRQSDPSLMCSARLPQAVLKGCHRKVNSNIANSARLIQQRVAAPQGARFHTQIKGRLQSVWDRNWPACQMLDMPAPREVLFDIDFNTRSKKKQIF